MKNTHIILCGMLFPVVNIVVHRNLNSKTRYEFSSRAHLLHSVVSELHAINLQMSYNIAVIASQKFEDFVEPEQSLHYTKVAHMINQVLQQHLHLLLGAA